MGLQEDLSVFDNEWSGEVRQTVKILMIFLDTVSNKL